MIARQFDVVETCKFAGLVGADENPPKTSKAIEKSERLMTQMRDGVKAIKPSDMHTTRTSPSGDPAHN